MERFAVSENAASLVSRTHVPNSPAAPANDNWISSAQALPQEGQSVEFVLEYRDIAMRGIYRKCVFRTRWSRYEPAAICEWRRVESACV